MALADKRLFLLDMDGTLYLDNRLFDKVPEFLSHVRRIGGRYLFLTNNSSRGVEGYMEKLSRMGIPTARMTNSRFSYTVFFSIRRKS